MLWYGNAIQGTVTHPQTIENWFIAAYIPETWMAVFEADYSVSNSRTSLIV